MPRSGSAGSRNLTPLQALDAVAARLAGSFRATRAEGSLRLVALGEGMPEVTLGLERDRRLFSRTLQLLVEATADGTGPAADATISMRLAHLRRRFGLEWLGPEPADAAGVVERFVRAGLVDGARTMTNVRALTLAWSPSRRSWRLRLATLAGALIGTSPGASVAVPLEPEDVDGLLRVLRAFRAAAAGAAEPRPR